MPGAWLAASIFAIHPVELQAVAWIGQQARLWSALFALGSLLLFLRASGVPRAPFEIDAQRDGSGEISRAMALVCYAGAFILYVMAVVCQPTMLALAPVYNLFKTWHKRPKLADLLPCLPFFAVSFFVAFLGLVTVYKHDHATGYLLGEALTVIQDAARLAVRIIWPHPVVAVISNRPLSPIAIQSYCAPAAIGASALACWWLGRRLRTRAPIAGFVCFVCLIPSVWDGNNGGPIGSLIPGRDACQYLVSLPLLVGCVSLLASSVSKVHTPLKIAIGRLALGSLLIGCFGTACWFASRDYLSTESLCAPRHGRRSFVGHSSGSTGVVVPGARKHRRGRTAARRSGPEKLPRCTDADGLRTRDG